MLETQVRSTRRAVGSRPALWWLAPLAAAGAWLLLAGSILSHRVFVSNDALSNYAHIWYIAESIWGRGTLPLHMPVLNHGEGYTFPYGSLPWIGAALLWRIFGEWAVSLLLVLGVVAATLAALRWQPVLRSPLLLALFLLNPFFIEAALLAQFPFLWATVCFFLGAAALRRGEDVQAALWLALAQITHPAVLMPPVLALALAYGWRRGRRRGVTLAYSASVLAALPAAYLTLATPALSENGALAVVVNYAGTLSLRALVLVAPPLLASLRPALLRHAGVAALVAVALPFAVAPLRRDLWALRQLTMEPSITAVAALEDATFTPGAVYRVLDAADGKVSMYRALRAGAVLDSDFFPESINRRNWSDPDVYSAFLQARRVQYVLITPAFDRAFRTNEHNLLRALAAEGRAALVFGDGYVEVFQMRAAME